MPLRLMELLFVISTIFFFRAMAKNQAKQLQEAKFLFLLFDFSLDVSRSRSDAKHKTIVISNERGQQSVLDLIQFFCVSCDGSFVGSRREAACGIRRFSSSSFIEKLTRNAKSH